MAVSPGIACDRRYYTPFFAAILQCGSYRWRIPPERKHARETKPVSAGQHEQEERQWLPSKLHLPRIARPWGVP